MSTIAEELTRIQNAKSALATSIAAKGVAVPATTKIDGYAALVDQISQGGGKKYVTGTITQVTAGSIFIPLPDFTPSVIVVDSNITVRGSVGAMATPSLLDNCAVINRSSGTGFTKIAIENAVVIGDEQIEILPASATYQWPVGDYTYISIE